MNIQVHDTTGASPYELVFGQKARTVIFPTQQNAIVLEEDLGISSEQATAISTSQHQAFRSEEDANTDVEQDAQCSMSSSHQGSATQNVVDEAEDTLHAEVSAAESETIERGVLEKNDDKLNGNELKCNGKRKCLREDALSTSLKHKKIRIKADRKYLSSAKKMAERYNKQHSTLSFVIGESVSVRIPGIDRASSDLSRLPCVVVEIVGGDQSLYRLRCQHGVLNVCYTAGELEKFNGSVVCTEENWQNQRFISLREAARKQASWNHFQCDRQQLLKLSRQLVMKISILGANFVPILECCKFVCRRIPLYLHYSEVDDLCEWVLNAREAFEKHTQSAENPFEHPVESESEKKGIINKRKCSSRTPKLWMTCGELKLYEADRVVLESNQSWLNDNIINAAQTLLKTKYDTPGLQNTLLTTALQGCVVGGEEFVQVLHSGGNHWLTVSTIGFPYSTVNIYDSMCCTLPHSTQKMTCALLVSHEPNVTLRFIDVDRQNNANDCGLYALAFASTLCSGKDPRHITFSKTDLRKHLLQCLMQNEMEPFPGEKLRRKKMVKETMILEIFCTCRSTQDGSYLDCEPLGILCLVTSARSKGWEKSIEELCVTFYKVSITEGDQQKGILVDKNLSNDFTSIMEDNHDKFASLPADSIQRIFWEQQKEAALLHNAKSLRWHPLVIKWCIYLRHLSGSAYELLRNTGCLKLPSQRTLRDYTYLTSVKVGFSSEIDAQLMKATGDGSKEYERCIGLITD
eukprot:Em0001g2138a